MSHMFDRRLPDLTLDVGKVKEDHNGFKSMGTYYVDDMKLPWKMSLQTEDAGTKVVSLLFPLSAQGREPVEFAFMSHTGNGHHLTELKVTVTDFGAGNRRDIEAKEGTVGWQTHALWPWRQRNSLDSDVHHVFVLGVQPIDGSEPLKEELSYITYQATAVHGVFDPVGASDGLEDHDSRLVCYDAYGLGDGLCNRLEYHTFDLRGHLRWVWHKLNRPVIQLAAYIWESKAVGQAASQVASSAWVPKGISQPASNKGLSLEAVLNYRYACTCVHQSMPKPQQPADGGDTDRDDDSGASASLGRPPVGRASAQPPKRRCIR